MSVNVVRINLGALEPGDKCPVEGCGGLIEEAEFRRGGCSCHISPPCSSCTWDSRCCDTCDWSADDEQEKQDKEAWDKFKLSPAFAQQKAEEAKRAEAHEIFLKKFRGELEATELEHHTQYHTHASMKVIGVFPKGEEAAMKAVITKMGTFGGRFERLGEQSFSYIAYTD